MKLGKKGKAWTNTRRALKRQFFGRQITTCELRYEGCWIDNTLSFAHSKRRRFIEGDELSEVILACCFCHRILDEKPREETYEIVREIIANRIDMPFEAA